MAKVLGKKALENAVDTAQTEALKKGLNGELAVIEVLGSTLPESCIVIWDPNFLRYKPDILIIDPDLGFIFLEVKNWSLPYVKKFLVNGKSETIHGLKYPLGQIDNYINELQNYINSMKKTQLDIYRSTSALIIYTGFSKEEFLNRGEMKNWKERDFQNYFSKHLFLEDLKIAPYSKLKSSKKFNTYLIPNFTIEELNYLAHTLAHTDNLEKESQSINIEASKVLQKEPLTIEVKNSLSKKTILYSFLILFVLTALPFFITPLFANTDKVHAKAIEDATFALANGEYQQALGLYELALNEKPEDDEANKLYESLLLLTDLTALSKSEEWETVITIIDELETDDNLPIHLTQKYQNLYKEAVVQKEENATTKKLMQNVEILVSKKEFDQAQSLLNELRTYQSAKQSKDKNEAILASLTEQIEKGKKELLQQEKVATSVVIENPKKIEVVKVSSRTKYLDKLNQIAYRLNELAYLYEGGITSNILEAENESLKRWDDALNEIYGVLKVTLNKDDMERLRNVQRDWISYRDYEAKLAASEFDGGSFEEVTLISVRQQLTRDRCYTLVENYMK